MADIIFQFINKVLTAILIVIVHNIPLFAQNNFPTSLAAYNFDQISLEQGLSQSTVNAVAQDKYGFMWFGTQDGLNRYDGYSIQVFKNDPDDSNSISDNRITSLQCDSKGDLWIGTLQGGVNKYDIEEGKFYHYKHNENQYGTISDNRIIMLYEDSDNTLWIGTEKGLNQYDSKLETFTYLSLESHDSKVVNQPSVNTVCEDKKKNLWVGTSKGLFKISLTDKSDIEKFDQLNIDLSTNYDEYITSLYMDHSGTIWIGAYSNVLRRYDEKSNSFINYLNTPKIIKAICEDKNKNLFLGTSYSKLCVLSPKKDDNNSFNLSAIVYSEDYRVNTFYKDKSGILWIGVAGQGVLIYDWHNNQFKSYLNDQTNPNDVKAILQDRDGTLWVGTNGNGLKRFNKQRTNMITYNFDNRNDNSISSNRIRAICESKDGSIWIGTTEGLNRFDKASNSFRRFKHSMSGFTKVISNNDITALYESSNGDLWIGNIAGGIDRYDRRKNVFIHYYAERKVPKILGAKSVTVFREEEDGSMIIGSLGEGLYRFSPEKNSFKPHPMLMGAMNDNVNSDRFKTVYCLYKDDDGIYWIGVYGIGLVRYDPKLNSIINFTEKDGLPNNVVYGILPDKSGNVWLSTNKGISCFNLNTKSFHNYDENNGLQSNEFNQGSYFVGSNGELFFGGINGFNSFFPEKIEQNESIPPVYLTNFKVFDELIPFGYPIPSDKTIELSYEQNFFTFEFVALNYTVPEKNQYAYLLDGFDKEWHYVTAKQRFASYTNLDPGEYTLNVKASNNDGVWSRNDTRLSIIIKPPFWMTWWVRGLGILLLVSVGPLIYYRRIVTLKKEKLLQQEISKRILEKQEEERSRIALEMHDVLGQDLLLIKNRLLLSIPKIKDNSITPENLNDISEDVSKVLKTAREISHNLRPPDLDQLGLTEALRSILHTLRKSTFIKVAGNIDFIDSLIPSEMEINFVRIIQEATGNIMKHSEATECRLDITNEKDKIFIEVSDNGKGFDLNSEQEVEKNHSGLGLIGMTERVRILDGTFKIDSAIGKGTRIKIEIPLKPIRS